MFITGNATRDDTPDRIPVQTGHQADDENVALDVPERVYEIPEDAPEKGEVDVIVNYTNCVQCGAITAKGGGLTTREGAMGCSVT